MHTISSVTENLFTDSHQAAKIKNRFILLGASNLTMSMRLIIRLMQHRFGAPSEVLAAAGHGRSYGRNSQVLVRELPGIICSDLWYQLHASKLKQPLQSTYAVLTDIGNDIPYGYVPEQILQWVSWCIVQLREHSARIAMTNLPINSIEALSEHRFNFLRSIFFPRCRLSYSEVVKRARLVHRGLIDLATCHKVKLYELEPEWMSVDSIHIALRNRCTFYQQLFEDLADNQSGPSFIETNDLSLLSWRKRPQFAVRKVLGNLIKVPQPSGYLADQTSVSLY